MYTIEIAGVAEDSHQREDVTLLGWFMRRERDPKRHHEGA